jgi:hypothetical protein
MNPSRFAFLPLLALACSASSSQPDAVGAPDYGVCGDRAIASIGPDYGAATITGNPLTSDEAGVVLPLRTGGSAPSAIVGGTATARALSTLYTTAENENLFAARADADHIFFLVQDFTTTPEKTKLESIPRGGGGDGAPTVLATFDNALDLAVASDRIVIAEFDSVVTVPKAGGAVTTIASGHHVDNVAVDGDTAVWAEGGFLFTSSILVRRAPLDGSSAPETLATLPVSARLMAVNDLAAASGTVVFTSWGGDDKTSITHAAISLVSASGVKELDSVDLTPNDAPQDLTLPLAVSGGFAFYSLDLGVQKVALDGSGGPQMVAQTSGQVDAVGVVPGGSIVYTVGRCVLSSPQPS